MPGLIVYAIAFVVCLLFKILNSMTTVTGGRYWRNDIFFTIDNFLSLPTLLFIEPIFRATWYDTVFGDTLFGDIVNTAAFFLFPALIWTVVILSIRYVIKKYHAPNPK